jgi:beta-lactamase class A
MQTLPISRRHFAQIAAAASLLSGCATGPRSNAFATALSDLERTAGGKLGVTFLVPATGKVLSHRGSERFAMASSFKLALAAVILREADQGRLSLTTQVPITQSDLVSNSPIVTENLARGSLSIGALAQAAQTTSDNAATNLLLRQIGGPAGLTAKLREMGDTVTRIDRFEPDMNAVGVNDPRDTTTPVAMAGTIAKMLTTDWLGQGSIAMLIEWMVATKTGTKRLRAGLPSDWKAGDKTGTTAADDASQPDRYNDIAITWPPSKSPMIIAAYYESPVKSPNMRDEDQAVLAQVGAIAAAWLGTL